MAFTSTLARSVMPPQMLTQGSRLVPELIPIGRDVVRSSKRDWLVRGRSAICFLISQSYGVSLGV